MPPTHPTNGAERRSQELVVMKSAGPGPPYLRLRLRYTPNHRPRALLAVLLESGESLTWSRSHVNRDITCPLL